MLTLAIRGSATESLHQLPYPRIYFNLILVPDAILTQKVELDVIGRIVHHLNVLYLKNPSMLRYLIQNYIIYIRILPLISAWEIQWSSSVYREISASLWSVFASRQSWPACSFAGTGHITSRIRSLESAIWHWGLYQSFLPDRILVCNSVIILRGPRLYPLFVHVGWSHHVHLFVLGHSSFSVGCWT